MGGYCGSNVRHIFHPCPYVIPKQPDDKQHVHERMSSPGCPVSTAGARCMLQHILVLMHVCVFAQLLTKQHSAPHVSCLPSFCC